MRKQPHTDPPDHHLRARALVGEMTEDERLWCLDGDAPFWAGLAYLGESGYHKSPFRSGRIDRLGLEGFAFSDGPRGVVIDQATCFPVSIARGATWDPDFEERIGEAIGTELRAVGADLYGGVCVNVLRHPAWGRAQETYGEDPYHVGMMGAALTRGVQRHTMACVKHLACNSMENARFTVDVTVDEVVLHEVYLPHFKRIVDEGVAAVMTAYNSVNGAWCGQNRTLITDILREEWGFDGFVISDWILGLRQAAESVRAGLDVEMPYRMVRARDLAGALGTGELAWSEVDAAAERVVATRLRFEDVLDQPRPDRHVLSCAAHRGLAREAASRSLVLLRNEPVDGHPVLPLDPVGAGTAVLLGALATQVNLGDGGSSDVWAPDVVTVADGMTASLGQRLLGVDDSGDPVSSAALASRADTAFVVVGYTRHDEGEFIGETWSEDLGALFPGEDDPDLVDRFEATISYERSIQPPPHVASRDDADGFSVGGDRRSLRLHDADVALLRAVVTANPRTVAIMVAGSAVITSEWDEAVPAVVQSWYAGMEGGHGIVDVLTGAVEPSGRLPMSVPRSEADLPDFQAEASAVTYDAFHGYWRLARAGVTPAYPFGFGLGYTTFELEEAETLLVSRDRGGTADPGTIRVAATLRNTGPRSGVDVLQVYGVRSGSGRPEKLCGFQRVAVPAGATRTVEIAVDLSALAERRPPLRAMVLGPGPYDLRVARNASDPGIPITAR